MGAEKLNRALHETIATMAKAMEFRDPYTAGHQERVTKIAIEIAKSLGWDSEKIDGLQMAANIHDIGKMAIPSEILTKPSRLSELEEKMMQAHPEKGYQLLKNIHFSWPIAQIVYQHHERIDGSGYPLGLKGDQILLEAKLLGIADTIEAMASHRPYRPAIGLIPALEEIKRGSGTKYDPDLVSVALKFLKGQIEPLGGFRLNSL